MHSFNLKKCLVTAAAMALTTGISQAGIIFNGGVGATVYGVTNYGGGAQVTPQWISNNLTGLNDILASPGGTYQLANPVVGNNVAQYPVAAPPLAAEPYFFNWTGGGNGNGNFGTGLTTVSGPLINFALSDTTAGCCSASYMISSWDSTFTVDNAGFAGTLGAFLAIAGINLTGADSSVAALQTEWQIGNGPIITLPSLILAAGGNCSNVALGGSGAAVVNVGCTNGGIGGAYAGIALDNLGLQVLVPGTVIHTISTLTAYSDPSSINDYFTSSTQIPLDTLLTDAGTTLPSFAISGVATPEPGSLALAGLGLAGALLARRRKK